jgi:hypothetical protein
MKNLLLLLCLAFFSVIVNAQSIPNGDFENWISGISNYPQYYQYNSNRENFFRSHLPFNVQKTSDSFHGSFAVRLLTIASATDTSAAYFVNSPTTDGSTWHGGVPYTLIPNGLRGYYKYNVATADSALVLAAFSKGGANIGMYFFKLGGIKTDYTLFNFTLTPPLSQAPDSVIFGATSSDFLINKSIAGSTLYIDSVSFTGVVSQPAWLNGDFESWQSETFYRPFGLYTQESGTERTSDAYAGLYAAKLTTFAGTEYNLPVARSAQIATGYYKESCSCMVGGYPYSVKKDTLVFYYKYAPAIANDSVSINLNFKKNGTNVWTFGKNFGASTTYKYAQIPFEMVTAPDSVIIDIRSSYWSNKSLSYVGAVLTIDEINFKSQMLPSNIQRYSDEKSVIIYPNPSGGKFTVQLFDNMTLLAKGKVEVYNEFGKKISTTKIKNQKLDIDLTGMPDGIYFVRIFDGVITHTEKIIKK